MADVRFKVLKYPLIFLVLVACSFVIMRIFFESSVLADGISKPNSISSFGGAGSIVFLLFGVGGYMGGVIRLAFRMRTEKDLNVLRSEILDLLVYGAATALGVVFFWLYLSWR